MQSGAPATHTLTERLMYKTSLYRKQLLMLLLLLQHDMQYVRYYLGVQAMGSPSLLSEGGGKAFEHWILCVCSQLSEWKVF